MRLPLPSTVKSLSKAYRRHRTLDAVIRVYGIQGVSKGTLSRILRQTGGVSWESEKIVRLALGSSGKRLSYLRPCLSHDPRRRLAQLTRLTEQAQAEIDT
jgi:hypothetical protein